MRARKKDGLRHSDVGWCEPFVVCEALSGEVDLGAWGVKAACLSSKQEVFGSIPAARTNLPSPGAKGTALSTLDFAG